MNAASDISMAERLFAPAAGRAQCHAVIAPQPQADAATQADALSRGVAELQRRHPSMRPVMIRAMVSDAANQASLLAGLAPEGCALSVIEQPPLAVPGMKMVALVMMEEPESDGPDSLHHIYIGDRAPLAPSQPATEQLLAELDAELPLLTEVVRTWFFVNDIDNNYAGLVQGRNEVFARCGLTVHTHFLASTGIAGRGADHHRPVTMNAYGIRGLLPAQVTYLQAPEHLNPTMEYGVAFERATAVDFADRRTLLLSGTASIDRHGAVVHTGHIEGQTLRMIENVEALLRAGGCSTADLMHAVVYLRDVADAPVVARLLAGHLPASVPVALVHAPVCRPGWLIEMEGIAVKAASHPHLPRF